MKLTKQVLKQIIKEELEKVSEAQELTPMQMAILALEKKFGAGSVTVGGQDARELAGLPPAPPTPPKPVKKKVPQQISPPDPTKARGYIDTSREGT